MTNNEQEVANQIAEDLCKSANRVVLHKELYERTLRSLDEAQRDLEQLENFMHSWSEEEPKNPGVQAGWFLPHEALLLVERATRTVKGKAVQRSLI